MSREQYDRGMLDAVTELKAEYSIGSSDAFAYLRCMRSYEATWRKIKEEHPHVVAGHSLTVKHIELLRKIIIAVLEHIVTSIEIAHSTPQRPLYTFHRFHDDILQKGYLEGDEARMWQADYNQCLIEFLCAMADQEKWGLTESTPLDIFEWIEPAAAGGTLIVSFLMTGESLNFTQFMREPVRYCSVCNPAEIWSNLGQAADESDSYEGFPDITLLDAIIEERDIVKTHLMLQRIRLLVLKEAFQYSCGSFMAHLTSGESHAEYFLYDPTAYERADRELTLGTYLVERRIALNAIHVIMLRLPGASSSEIVEGAIDYWTERFNMRRDSEKRIGEFDPEQLMRERTHRMTEEARYTLLALKQNRRWLLKFLSR